MTQPPTEPAARAARTHSHGASADLADRMGIGVSLTCAVHCVATGALSLAPSLVSVGHGGEGSTLGEALEMMETPLLGFALLIGLYSLVPAYRNEHRNAQPLVLFLVGLSQLVASRFVQGPLEIALTVLGVGLVASAHVLNLRACTRAHRALSHGTLSA